MNITKLTDNIEKNQIARRILEALPEWFRMPAARESYIEESKDKLFFCAQYEDEPAGFLYFTETGKDTMELTVIGVLKDFQRRGIGKALFETAKKEICQMGYSFIQVKTLKKGIREPYDKTNEFYVALGFKEFEVFPDLWSEECPCQVYVMAI